MIAEVVMQPQLTHIRNLIMKYARALASKRTTWGDRQPTADDARKFITACVAEWTQAVRQLLKHWDTAPSTTGT